MSKITVPRAPALYARISLDKTGRRLGVERQIEECRELCRRMGWPEPTVYVDNDISAKSGKRRPGFEALLADIESGKVDALVAWHLDRLLRRVLDLERVVSAVESQKRVVPAVFAKAGEIDLTTASGRMLARILASVASAEVELKAERIAAQRRQEAMAGKAPSVLGYGYNSDGSINAEEAAVVREVAERLLNGASIHSIAVDLNERGVPTPAAGRWESRRVAAAVKRGNRPDLVELIGSARAVDRTDPEDAAALIVDAGGELYDDEMLRRRPWGAVWCGNDVGLSDSDIAEMLTETSVAPDPTAWRSSALASMVTRAALCGWREFSPGQRGEGEFVAKGDWAPILSRDTVETLRAQFRRRPGTPGRKPKYLLSGVLVCKECKHPMMGGPSRSGHRYGCMRQPGKPHCGKVSIAGSQVDQLVTAMMVNVLADADVRAGLKRPGPADDEIRAAEDELAEVARMRREYAEDAAAGVIRRDEWKTLRDGLTKRQKEAEAVLGTWSPRTMSGFADVPVERDKVVGWWEMETVERKREVLRSFIESIEVAPNRNLPGSTRFDAGRLGEPVWLV